jgi:hypothetical protein
MVESNDTIAAVTLVQEPDEQCMSNNITEHVMTDTALSMQGSVNAGELSIISPSPNKGFFPSIISYFKFIEVIHSFTRMIKYLQSLGLLITAMLS